MSLTSLNHSDRYDYRISRIDLSGDHLINQCDQLRGYRNWIDGSAGPGAMASPANNANSEILTKCGSRPGCDSQVAGFAVRVNMESDNSKHAIDRSLFY